MKELYRVGQIFLLDGGYLCLLAQVGPAAACSLIYIRGGNRWSNPVNVNNPAAITPQEMRAITSGDDFVLSKGSVTIELENQDEDT